MSLPPPSPGANLPPPPEPLGKPQQVPSPAPSMYAQQPVYAPSSIGVPEPLYGQSSVNYMQYQPLSEPPKFVRPPLAIGATVCAVFTVIGSILPWGTLDLDSLGSVTIDGLDRDGILTIVLGLAIVGVLIVSIAIGAVWPIIIGGGLFGVLAIISFIDFNDIRTLGGYNSGDLGFDLTDSVSVGIGLWLLLASSVIGVILCVIAFATREVADVG